MRLVERLASAAVAASWPLVGRANELSRVVAAVESRDGRGVVVAGPAGVGKTRLVREAVRAMRARKHVVWVSATPASGSIPFGAFASLLPKGDASIERDHLGLLRSVTDSLLRQANGRALLLVVDDAHCLDPGAVAAVELFAAMGVGQVLLSVRSGEILAEPVLSLWKNDDLDRIELAPLDQLAVETLLGLVFDGPVDPRSTRRLWQLSQGNPMFLRELVMGVMASNTVTVDGDVRYLQGDVPMTNRLALIVEDHLGRLGNDARAVLQVLAIGEPLPCDVMSWLFDDDAVAQAERAGLATVGDEEPLGYRLTHPLYGEVLRQSLTGADTRAIKSRLVTAMAAHATKRANLIRVATWAVETASPFDVGLLTNAARLASGLGDPRTGARLAQAAFDGGGGFAAGLTLGDALNRAERFDEGETVLSGLVDRAVADQDLVDLTIARYRGLVDSGGHRPELQHLLLDTERRVGDESLRGFLRSQRATLFAFCGHLDDAVAIATRAEDDPPDDKRDLRAVPALGTAWMFAGKPTMAGVLADRMLPVALRRQAELPDAPNWVIPIQIFARIFAGQFDVAERQIADIERLDTVAGPHVARFLALCRGMVALYQGKPRTARRLLLESIVESPHRLAFTSLSEACALLGDAAGAEEATRNADRLAESWPIFQAMARRAAAWAAYVRKERSRAVSAALDAATWSREHHAYGAEMLALHDAVRFGAKAAAPRLADAASGCEGPFATCVRVYADAVSSGDGTMLDAAASRFEEIGALLLAAESASQASAAHRRARADTRSRKSDTHSRFLAHACEGARSPLLDDAALPSQLTHREREIALLAAERLTARAISERLLVSVRTVEGHLHRIYTKLGVSDRQALERALQVIDSRLYER